MDALLLLLVLLLALFDIPWHKPRHKEPLSAGEVPTNKGRARSHPGRRETADSGPWMRRVTAPG